LRGELRACGISCFGPEALRCDRLADRVGSCEEAYDVVIDREAAKEGLRLLPERERAILYMRFFEDMTQSRIVDQPGISPMHVSRLISRYCARIRDTDTC
jgi:RNA polymerase sigma-B factor